MSLRDTVRERSEARYFAMDTLKSTIEWIKVANPQSYLFTDATVKKGEEPIIRIEDMRTRMTEWVNKSGDLVDKAWSLPYLLVNDAIMVLKNASLSENAEQKSTPQNK